MGTYDKFFHQFENSFFASVAISVLVQSCVGGIAAMMVLTNGTSILQMIQLFIVVATSIAFNGAVLSQQTAKTTYNLLLLTLVVNTLIAILNMI